MMQQQVESTSGYNFSYINQILLLFKVIFNFACIAYIQNVVLTKFDPQSPDYNPIDHSSYSVIWLIFYLLIFYFNIISQIVFLVVCRVFEFRTIRDRMQLGGDKRNQIDFLDHVRDDVHWFQIVFTQFGLTIFSLIKREQVGQASFQSSIYFIIA